MKKIIKNVFFVALSALALGACKTELETTPVTTNGKIDLTRYVAVGNSLTAGFADGGVYLESQQNSYPLFLSEQFAKAGGGTFTQPLFASDKANGSGYLVLATPGVTSPTPIVAAASTFAFTGTKLFGAMGPNTGENQLIAYAGTGNQNLGVPGIAVVHVTDKSYSLLNPYFDRLLTTTQRGNGTPIPANGITYVDYAAASNPTFFTCWLGNNDVLGYATGGGEAESPMLIGRGAITPQSLFDPSYDALVNTLTKTPSNNKTGTKGVLATIPDVTSLPYFTTVKESNLPRIVITDGGFSVYGRPKTDLPGLPAVGPFFPGVMAVPTASQVASFFNALYLANGYTDPGFTPGENLPIIIVNVPSGTRSPINPTVVKKFSAGSGDLIVLPFSGAATTLFTAGGGFLTPTNAPNPLGDKWFLDASEVAKAQTATNGFNTKIKKVAESKGLALFDAKVSFNEIIANNGIDDVSGTTSFITGGLFSLDGVHLTPRGYGAIANQFIKAINAGYNTNIPVLDVRQRGLRGVRIP